MEARPTNWHKVCYVPTKADAILSGYRRWLNKYSNGGVNWGSKFNGGALPPTPLREELLDRCVNLPFLQESVFTNLLTIFLLMNEMF